MLSVTALMTSQVREALQTSRNGSNCIIVCTFLSEQRAAHHVSPTRVVSLEGQREANISPSGVVRRHQCSDRSSWLGGLVHDKSYAFSGWT
jgi:hypothetical protein